MRFAPSVVLAALSLLWASPASAQNYRALASPASAQNYRALYDVGLRLEARAAATPTPEMRMRNYRLAAAAFERALLAREREGITDQRIYNALGAVYLGAGDLVRADAHLQRGLANARLMSSDDRASLYNTVGYLNALRGDNVAARRYYQLSASLGNQSAQRNLTSLRGAQAR